MTSTKEAFGRTFAALAGWWRGWQRSRKTAAELESCGSDIGRIARDVGLPSGELRVIAAKRPDAADLLALRMGRLHLDPAAFAISDGGVRRDLQRLCTLCGSKTRCAKDLAHNAATESWQEYCPNSETLNSLVADADREKAIARLNRREARRRMSDRQAR